MLEQKSLHQLRSIAQGYNIPDIFAKTRQQLEQDISLKQTESIPKPEPKPVAVEYDARLMSRPPAKICTREILEDLLSEHINRGLVLTFPTPEEWHMKLDRREDTGTMRQPPRNVLECANRIFK